MAVAPSYVAAGLVAAVVALGAVRIEADQPGRRPSPRFTSRTISS
jgi:hypothetical protein